MLGGHAWGPLLPFFIEWRGDAHPSRDAPRGCRLASFRLQHPDAGDLSAVLSAIGLDLEVRTGPAPVLRAEIESPRGLVTSSGPPPRP